MDRSAVSVTAPFLMRDLGLDPAQLGIVFSGFFAGYALFNFAGGYASDVLGPKRVGTLAMTAWSAFCGLTAAATGFRSLLLVRLFFGFGEGPFAATANKIVANSFPRRQAATAVGLANAGTPIGGVLAGPVAGWLALHYGWRTSFVALAGIGFLWTLAWIPAVAHRPEAHAAAPGSRKLPLSFYLRQPSTIGTAAAFFGYSYVLYFFLTWFPSYLTMSRHLSIRDMGFVNTIPWIFGVLGLTTSGLACDLLSHVTNDVLRARKLVLVVCLSASAICVSLAGLVPWRLCCRRVDDCGRSFHLSHGSYLLGNRSGNCAGRTCRSRGRLCASDRKLRRHHCTNGDRLCRSSYWSFHCCISGRGRGCPYRSASRRHSCSANANRAATA